MRKRKLFHQESDFSGKKRKTNGKKRGFKNFKKIFKNANEKEFRIFARISRNKLAELSAQSHTTAPLYYSFGWDLKTILTKMKNLEDVEVSKMLIKSWKDEMSTTSLIDGENEFTVKDQTAYLLRRRQYVKPAIAFLEKYEDVLSNPPFLSELDDEATESESSSSENENEEKSNPKKIPTALIDMFPDIKITENDFKTLACLSIYASKRDVKSQDGVHNLRPYFHYDNNAWLKKKVERMMESITPQHLKKLFITDEGKNIREPLRQEALETLAKFKDYFLSRGFQESDFELEYSSKINGCSESLSSTGSSTKIPRQMESKSSLEPRTEETLAQNSSSYSSASIPEMKAPSTTSLVSIALSSQIQTTPQLFLTMANFLKENPSILTPENKYPTKEKEPKTPPRTRTIKLGQCKMELFTPRSSAPAIPGQRELSLHDGDSKGKNRDSSPSLRRAMGLANAQNINRTAASTRPIHPDKLDKSVFNRTKPDRSNKSMDSTWDIFKSRLTNSKKTETGGSSTAKPSK